MSQTIEYVNVLLLYLCVYLLLQSLFFMLRAYRRMPKINFFALSFSVVLGMFHIMYNMDLIIKSPTFPLFFIFLLGVSSALYLVSKIERDMAYVMTSDLVRAYNIKTKQVARKFRKLPGNNETKIITRNDLKAFKIGVLAKVDGIYIIRYGTAFDGLFFVTVFPPRGVMSKQRHPKLKEWCFIVEGEMKDLVSGRVYKKGDFAVYDANDPHEPINNSESEKLILHVYFETI